MKEFSKFENANAILNGMEDCSDEFVASFVELHKQPVDNEYMYEWLLRSILDTVKTNHSVLYVACGTSGYRRLFKNIRRFVGIDFSKKMIEACKKNDTCPSIDFEFNCTTFEDYVPKEKFDVIYLGPYGNNVPFTNEILDKAKSMLANDGMLFCTTTDPMIYGIKAHIKEFIKNLLMNKTFNYHPVNRIEKMIENNGLDVWVKLRMKTIIGYSYCYIVKNK